MLSYTQLHTIVIDKQRAENEIRSITEDSVRKQKAWIVEFKSLDKKVVLVPPGAADAMDEFGGTKIPLYAADANYAARCSAGMALMDALHHPWVLFYPSS